VYTNHQDQRKLVNQIASQCTPNTILPILEGSRASLQLTTLHNSFIFSGGVKGQLAADNPPQFMHLLRRGLYLTTLHNSFIFSGGACN
jgi:hypothetical protein